MSTLNEKEILIIDDSREIRMLAAKILENDGAIVRHADSVEKGLVEIAQTQPHLILLDLNFAVESGFSVLSARAANPNWKDIPTVVLSGMSDKSMVVKAASLGATDYLLKPFRAGLLLQKVRKALRLSTFQTFVFPENKRPTAEVTLQAQLQKISEAGFQLECSAKLESNQVVKVESEFLSSAGAGNAITKTSARPSNYNGQGRYVVDFQFTGVGEEFTKQMKKSLKRPA